MLRLLILAGLLYVAWRFVKSALPRGDSRPPIRPGDPGKVDTMVQDPVCGIYFPRQEGVALHRDGQEKWFCSNECKNKYLNDNS